MDNEQRGNVTNLSQYIQQYNPEMASSSVINTVPAQPRTKEVVVFLGKSIKKISSNMIRRSSSNIWSCLWTSTQIPKLVVNPSHDNIIVTAGIYITFKGILTLANGE